MTDPDSTVDIEQSRAAAKAALDHELLAMSRRYAARGVLVQFLARSGKVSITKLEVDADLRGVGMARKVMTQICAWADDHGHILGIGPSGQWGADVDRLTAFYVSLGFVDNPQPHDLFRVSDAMIREPADAAPASRADAG